MVVGIGADGLDGLSATARAEVANAQVVLGSERQLALIGEHAGTLMRWPSPLVPALPGLLDRLRGHRVCALASGDPMFFGLGSTLVRVVGAERLRVIPHPSSVSLACARLGWPLQDARVVSLVARPIARLTAALAPDRRLLVLTADADGPAEVAEELTRRGYGASEITVLEQLGGPGERVRAATAGAWTLRPGDPLAIVAVRCRPDPDTRPLSPVGGLPDETFENDGQLTKREIRAVTLARLAPLPGQLLWDVGAGAGSVALEWLRADPTCRAIAIESDPERAARIGRNAETLGVEPRVVVGAAPAALAGLQTPDTVFVGGGVSRDLVVGTSWEALRPGGRIVVNAVTLEAEATVTAWHARVGGSLTRIEIQRAGPIGGLTAWRPAMPVTQWVAEKGA